MSLRSELSKFIRGGQKAGAGAPKGALASLGKPPQDPSDFSHMSTFEKVLDVISRPLYASAGAAGAAVKGEDPFAGAYKGFTGTTRSTYSDVLGTMGMEPGLARGALGFGLDIALDPISYLTFGEGAGAKVAFGGVTKTLTAAGKLVHEAAIAERTAKYARLLPRVAEKNPGMLDRLINLTGLGMRAEKTDAIPVLAKQMAEATTARDIIRAGMEKKAGRLAPHMGGIKPEDLLERQTLRFAGRPIIHGEPLKAAGKGLGRLYQAGEGLPLLGAPLRALHGAASAASAAFTKHFTPGSGMAAADAIYTAGRDKLNRDLRGLADVYGEIAAKRIKLAAGNAEEEKLANRQIQTFMEGLVEIQSRKLAPEEEIRQAKDLLAMHVRALEGSRAEGAHLAGKLAGIAEAGKGAAARVAAPEKAVAEKMPTFAPEIEEALGKKAAKFAQAETKEARRQKRDIYGPLLKEMREKGVSRGDIIGTEEYLNTVPKSMRRASAPNISAWAERLKEAGAIHGTSEDEVMEWISKATGKLKVVRPEEVKESLRPAVTEEVFRAKVTEERAAAEKELERLRGEYAKAREAGGPPMERLKREGELQKAITEQEGKIAEMEKPVQRPVRVLGAGAVAKKFPDQPMHPIAREIAETLVSRMERIHQAEQAGLALPPEYRLGYAPHVMAKEFKDAIVDIFRSGQGRNVMRPEFSQGLSSSLRRTMGGGVGDASVDRLVELGVFDPSKVKDALKKRGIHMTADDMLLFEQDPIQAAFHRELRSVRALNAAETAKQVLEGPFFTKARVLLDRRKNGKLLARDPSELRKILAQHPGHALYVPTKTFIEHLRTPEAKEAMRQGAEKDLVRSMLQEIFSGQIHNLGAETKAETRLPGALGELAEAAQPVQAFVIPREVAEHLTRAYSMQFDDESTKAFVRMWDKFTSWWKMSATVPRPGFHLRNAMSNLWNMALGGFSTPGSLWKSFLVLRHPDAIHGVGRWSGPEVKQLAERYGVFGSGIVTSDIEDLVRREVAPSKNPLSMYGPVARAGGRVGRAIEDHARLSMFMDGLEKGMDPAAAAMRTKKYLFDYQALSKTEKGILRRVIPFYTWTRMNLPLQFETLLTKPGYAAAMGKARYEGEKNVEDAVDRPYVSDFIRDNLGVPMRRNAEGKTEFFLLNGWVPTADLSKLDAGEFFSMLHPAIKTPIEQAINRNVFSGQAIARFPGEQERLLGLDVNTRVAHVLRNLVFLQELDRVLFRGVSVEDMPEKAIGIRTYKQDKAVQMRQRVVELQREMGEAKTMHAVASQKYGADSDIARQYQERLAEVEEERNAARADLLAIDPTALTPRREQIPGAKPPPAMALVKPEVAMRRFLQQGAPR